PRRDRGARRGAAPGSGGRRVRAAGRRGRCRRARRGAREARAEAPRPVRPERPRGARQRPGARHPARRRRRRRGVGGAREAGDRRAAGRAGRRAAHRARGGVVSRKRTGPHFVPVEDAPRAGLSDRSREVLALALIGACLYALLSLATFDLRGLDDEIARGPLRNLGGLVGYLIADGCTFVFGFAAWIPFFAGIGWGLALFLGKRVDRPVLKLLGIVVLAAMVALLLAGPGGDTAATRLAPYGRGGLFGANLSPKLAHAFGGSGRILLLAFGALCALLLATEWMFSTML